MNVRTSTNVSSETNSRYIIRMEEGYVLPTELEKGIPKNRRTIQKSRQLLPIQSDNDLPTTIKLKK